MPRYRQADPPGESRHHGVCALFRVLWRSGGQAAWRDNPVCGGIYGLALREPYGVTGHIIPWNYPAQILGRTVGASLAAGNACVVKPAEDACLSVVRVAELALECGLPPGVFNVITGLGVEAGAALAAHDGHRSPVVHRLASGRLLDRAVRSRQSHTGGARTRRQVASDCVSLTQTWTKRFRWSSMRSCKMRVRPARLAAGCSSSGRSTIGPSACWANDLRRSRQDLA